VVHNGPKRVYFQFLSFAGHYKQRVISPPFFIEHMPKLEIAPLSKTTLNKQDAKIDAAGIEACRGGRTEAYGQRGAAKKRGRETTDGCG